MISKFDRKTFENIDSPDELSLFVNALDASNAWPQIDELRELVVRCREYDPFRKMCVIRWGIKQKFPGIEDIAIDFYVNEHDQGAQYTILLWLEEAAGLTSGHIDRLEQTPTCIPAEELVKQLALLRKRINQDNPE